MPFEDPTKLLKEHVLFLDHWEPPAFLDRKPDFAGARIFLEKVSASSKAEVKTGRIWVLSFENWIENNLRQHACVIPITHSRR